MQDPACVRGGGDVLSGRWHGVNEREGGGGDERVDAYGESDGWNGVRRVSAVAAAAAGYNHF